MKKTFELISEKAVHQNDYFTVLDRHYRLPNRKEHHFFVNQEVDTCCVLALTKDRKFIAVKEFRVGPQKEMMELPAGRFEGFEDDGDERIKAELLQETGYQGTFKKVGAMPTSPYSTRYIHCYYAIDCEKISKQKLDHTEFIDVELLSIEEMRTVLMNGESSSCAPGLLAWEHMKKDGVLPEVS